MFGNWSAVMFCSTEITDAMKTLFLRMLNYFISNNMAFIYALEDPRTNKGVYIGATANPLTRLVKHRSETLKEKKEWFNELANSDLKPKLKFIDFCQAEEADLCEQWWIDYYRFKGEASLNKRNVCNKHLLGLIEKLRNAKQFDLKFKQQYLGRSLGRQVQDHEPVFKSFNS